MGPEQPVEVASDMFKVTRGERDQDIHALHTGYLT